MIWEQETLNVIGRTLLHEFSDLSDVEQGTRVTLRLVLAVLLGGLLGMEREQQGKEAGVRTHMLVSLGAALFVLVPDMAGVWLTAAIGVTIGLGHEATALLAAAMAFVILHLVPSFMRRNSSGR